MALDWDKVNESCSALTNWNDYSTGTSAVTQVTYDGQSTFKFNTPADAGAGYVANIQLVSTYKPASTGTLEYKIYTIDDADGIATTGCFHYVKWFVDTSGYPRYTLAIKLSTGPTTYPPQAVLYTDTNTWFYARLAAPGTSLCNAWHTVRMVIKDSRKVDIWFDNRCIMADVTCAATTTGYAYGAYQQADDNYAAITYMDYFKADTTPQGMTTSSPLKMAGKEIVVRPVGWTGTAWQGEGKLHMRGQPYAGAAVATLDVPLVATTDTNASAVRIYDGSAVKALMKLPS